MTDFYRINFIILTSKILKSLHGSLLSFVSFVSRCVYVCAFICLIIQIHDKTEKEKKYKVKFMGRDRRDKISSEVTKM